MSTPISRNRGFAFITILIAVAIAVYFLSDLPSRRARALVEVIALLVIGADFAWLLSTQKSR